MSYRIVSIDDFPDLESELEPLTYAVWPEFMLQDPVAFKYWSRLFSDFSMYQLALLEGDTLVGAGNSIPFAWDGAVDDLPDGGWDWAFDRAIQDVDAGRQPQTLVGLQIMIAPSHQRKGLSCDFIKALKETAARHKLKRLIIPVRPTLKHKYPLTSIERYITWQDNDGLPFDPWLRVHVRAGARIVKACSRSMVISRSVADWQEWTGLVFPESGRYIVPQALVPVEINREEDRGIYIEPNVWVEHQVG
jgi:hypothetical protein